jgi:hypothetical protein
MRTENYSTMYDVLKRRDPFFIALFALFIADLTAACYIYRWDWSYILHALLVFFILQFLIFSFRVAKIEDNAGLTDRNHSPIKYWFRVTLWILFALFVYALPIGYAIQEAKRWKPRSPTSRYRQWPQLSRVVLRTPRASCGHVWSKAFGKMKKRNPVIAWLSVVGLGVLISAELALLMFGSLSLYHTLKDQKLAVENYRIIFAAAPFIFALWPLALLRPKQFQTAVKNTEPNQSLQTTIMAVTDAAAQPPRQPWSRLTSNVRQKNHEMHHPASGITLHIHVCFVSKQTEDGW